ncbi:MAG: transcription-repair coupling factor [Chlorobiaceae bacterium]|nr:transcription-repair coupling factor [Chlorobiaceae bacterium]
MKTLSLPPGNTLPIVKRSLPFLFDLLRQSDAFRLLSHALRDNPPDSITTRPQSVTVTGLSGSLVSLTAANCFLETKEPIVVLCRSENSELYENDFSFLVPEGSFFDLSEQTPLAIEALASKRAVMLLTSFDDLLQPLCEQAEIENKLFRLRKNTDAGYERLKSFLRENRFEHREFVEDEGEFSVRGSIIDIFSFGSGEPLRIEFFGDTVSSLRSFDINSQLSGRTLDIATITGNFVPEKDNLLATPNTILDFLPPSAIIFIDDPAEFAAQENREPIEQATARFRQVRRSPLSKDGIHFGSEMQRKFSANFRLVAAALEKSSEKGCATLFASASKREIDELAEFLGDELHDKNERERITIEWLALNLHSGFSFAGIDLYTESDIFGKFHTHKSHKKRKIKGISLKDLHRLKIGDYVVHEDYGIGIFKSLETITVGNSDQECVLLEYEGGDQLFVNVQSINLISKYSAAEGSQPILSKLGSGKWAAKKEKVRKKIRDIAINLIRLYAERTMKPGFAFEEDSIFMRELEASFIFEETPDQLKAIEEVKTDMQKKHPMDRLICGDAGFGKTEIAMRAAFKAVESKKQVAILTPTTILAHQHLESFERRFENFPISITALSRFIPRKEQQERLRKIETGEIDIVIGTHRIVSKDVRFKDLGLLIIDEEQHFGVEVKEKLREAHPEVDTLTMSATPIPRTLQFSMLGARDLSIVSTPPKNRQPVETIISDYDTSVIKAAIEREIKRQGQVFFLHNRISDLDEMQQTLRDLVPYARIVYAHGQMPSRELEKIMMDFMQQEVDVLISTSIIGSGLDISNANTIIINRADKFGLADLYQLRGRVGRSERKAFCYLIVPPLNTLKREAVQRLAVIESFTELGSGFTVALRDLDIRGAGNLLGAEQSGFIHELGFDLYQKMLEETVAELKSTVFRELFAEGNAKPMKPAGSCDLVFFFDALIPDYYISAVHERFVFYEKISKSRSESELDAIGTELGDRFGQLPDEVNNMLRLSKLKIIAASNGIRKIDLQPDTFTVFLPETEEENAEHLAFFQSLFSSVQQSWMVPFKPGFSMEKKMKLVLHRPSQTPATPSELLATYTRLLLQLEEASKIQTDITTDS